MSNPGSLFMRQRKKIRVSALPFVFTLCLGSPVLANGVTPSNEACRPHTNKLSRICMYLCAVFGILIEGCKPKISKQERFSLITCLLQSSCKFSPIQYLGSKLSLFKLDLFTLNPRTTVSNTKRAFLGCHKSLGFYCNGITQFTPLEVLGWNIYKLFQMEPAAAVKMNTLPEFVFVLSGIPEKTPN